MDPARNAPPVSDSNRTLPSLHDDLVDPRARCRRPLRRRDREPLLRGRRAVRAHAPRRRRAATQALMNPLYGPAGLDAAGRRRDARRGRRGADQRRRRPRPAPAARAAGARRAGAAYTGGGASTGAATSAFDGFSVAGNMLAGPAGARGDRAGASRARAAGRSPSACWRRWRRARRPAATSAASRPRRCASTPTRTIRSSTSASTTTPSRSPSCGACTRRASSASSRSSPASPAGRPGRHHRPRRDRGSASRRFRAARGATRLMSALLEVRDLRTDFATDDGRVPGGRRRELHGRGRPHAGHRRRIGLRQERHRAVDHGPGAAAAGPHRRRLDPLRGPRADRRCAGARCATCAATASR